VTVENSAGAKGSSRSLKILFLAPQPFFEVRGTPLAVLAMVRTLTGLGHRVDLLTYPQGEAVDVPGLRHHRSLPLPVGRVKAGPSLAKLALDVPFVAEAAWRLFRGRYDVVHAVEEAAHLIAPFARRFRVPLVVDIDSSIPDQLQESGFARRGPLLWAARRLEARALAEATAVVTVCTSLTEGVKARVPTARVFQVEDPPLLDDFTPPPAHAVATFRASLGLDARPVVLYSGNFEPYQGVELLVAAAARLPSAQFLFMGGAPEQVEAMRRQAVTGGGACVFAGRRPPAELPLFLAASDLLCSPRVKGANTPFKVYTYLASGKPLVATRIVTHTQLLDDKTSWLVEPTAEGLAAGIATALSKPFESELRARRGRTLVENEYSAARYAAKVAAAYKAVAAGLTGA
jgi:glycosyltransferase involved in cell wall biosynthesis